jgi:hypothetical protein
MPLVTVLMAVHNGGPFLRESIESILGQTFTDFEFLIVDDGSSDGSRDVVRSYDDPRIRLIVNENNCGLPASLNRGLAQARGAYIARQDADDISEPYRLARQIDYLQRHHNIALLGTAYTKIDESGKAIGHREMPLQHTRIRWCLLFFCPFAHTSVMFRHNAVLDRVGMYDESFSYAQDYDFWWRIADQFAVSNLKLPEVRVRISSSSMTATYGSRLMEGPQISVSHIAPLLGWNPADSEGNLADYQSMHRVLYGSPGELTPVAIRRAVSQISQLAAAFCRNNNLDVDESRKLTAAVRSRLAWRLVTMAGRCSHEEYAEFRDLVGNEWRLHWLNLFAYRIARRAFVGCRGPRIVAALEQRRSL